MNKLLTDAKEEQERLAREADLFVRTAGLPEGYVLVELNTYLDLKEESDFLKALQAAGVENWEGYEIVCEELYD